MGEDIDGDKPNYRFGLSVCLSRDGRRLAVGADGRVGGGLSVFLNLLCTTATIVKMLHMVIVKPEIYDSWLAKE